MRESNKDKEKDSLFIQSVKNLMEYQLSRDDYTQDEKKEADELFVRYSYVLADRDLDDLEAARKNRFERR